MAAVCRETNSLPDPHWNYKKVRVRGLCFISTWKICPYIQEKVADNFLGSKLNPFEYKDVNVHYDSEL